MKEPTCINILENFTSCDLEVFFQDEVILDAELSISYIKSGEDEIKYYLETVSKLEIDSYVTEQKNMLVEVCQSKTDEVIEGLNYYKERIILNADEAFEALSEVRRIEAAINENIALSEGYKNEAKDNADVCQMLSFMTGLPVGSVITSSAEEMSGYLLANGAEVSRDTYSNLFTVIGTTYGGGDGRNTFNIPDFRGCFIRGLGGDATDAGVKQGCAAPNISGTFHIRGIGGMWGAFTRETMASSVEGTGSVASQSYRLTFNASDYNSTYGAANEVRPINHALNYFIKY